MGSAVITLCLRGPDESLFVRLMRVEYISDNLLQLPDSLYSIGNGILLSPSLSTPQSPSKCQDNVSGPSCSQENRICPKFHRIDLDMVRMYRK